MNPTKTGPRQVPDQMIGAINALCLLHKLTTDDTRTSIITYDRNKRLWVLNGSFPLDVDEVVIRLAKAGANVGPIIEGLKKSDAEVVKSAGERERLRKSAAAKLTPAEREAVGI